MSREREDARTLLWRGKWYLFWYDHKVGKQRRRRLTKAEARNEKTRKQTAKDAQQLEREEAEEVRRRGGSLAYDTPLVEGIAKFRSRVERRVSVRQKNPGAGKGLAESSGKEILTTLDLFEGWMKSSRKLKVTTAEFDGNALERFFDHLAETPSKHGKREVMRSASTINKHQRNIQAMLTFLDDERPQLFPDFKIFRKALQPLRTDKKPPVAYKPSELAEFLKAALEREDPERKVVVHRKKNGGKLEVYEQRISRQASTPVSRLFILLTLTGCRLGSALKLTWDKVDFEAGLIEFIPHKKSFTRKVPLVNAPEGDVAPLLFELLKIWRAEDPRREYVLPHGELNSPTYDESAWKGTNRKAGGPRIAPQRLRQNFCSFACSLGVPAATVAGWQGHRTEVAENYYRAQVLQRNPGETFEAAMGLSDCLRKLVERTDPETSGKPRKLEKVPASG